MVKVPTLTSAGWVSDIVTKATSLMDYFLTSEESQSQLFRGNISSLPYLVQQHGNEPYRLEERTQSTLTRYLSKYFEEAQVRVSADNLESEDGRYNLTIDITLTDAGRQHSFGSLIEVGESRILNVTNKQG